MKELKVSCFLKIQGYKCQAVGAVIDGRVQAKYIWIPGDCVLELADLDENDQQKVITALEAEWKNLGPKG